MNTSFVKRTTQIWVLFSLLGVGGLMYILGRIEGLEGTKAQITVEYPDEVAVRQVPEDVASSSPSGGSIVASKNGERYYTDGCSGIDRILPENRIYFSTSEEAEATGRTLAKSCQ